MNLREQIEKEITDKVMTKLASERVELNIVGDIKKDTANIDKQLQNVQRIIDNIDKLWGSLNSAVSDVENMKTQLKNITGAQANLGGSMQDALKTGDKAEKLAKDLGLDVMKVDGFDKLFKSYDKAVSVEKNVKKAIDKGSSILKKLK